MTQTVFQLRLSLQEKEDWKRAAADSGMSLSEWIRRMCNRVAGEDWMSRVPPSFLEETRAAATADYVIATGVSAEPGWHREFRGPDPRKK